jgi:hypothetical protein
MILKVDFYFLYESLNDFFVISVDGTKVPVKSLARLVDRAYNSL